MEGYAKLALLFNEFPELTCLRRFSEINTELLLYKQAELCHIEQDIKALRVDESKDSARQWKDWNLDATDDDALRKRKLFESLDVKLRLYQEDILRAAQVYALRQPSKLSTESVADWLARKDGGDRFLKAVEAMPWNPKYRKDLISVAPQPDKLDRFFESSLASPWHWVVGGKKRPVDAEKGLGNLWAYPTRHFVRLANVFCVLMSASVPSASILGLYYVESMVSRLIMITFFTLAFAGIVLLGFGCRRSDTFAATVAFAAVQVVFVQGVEGIKS